MSFNLKDALNGIFMKGDYNVPKDYNQYIINYYLSKYKSYIEIVDILLPLRLPNKAHFKFLQKHIPYGWPRKVEIKEPEKSIDEEYLMRFYECSRRDAKDYLKFISKEELDQIKDYYEE